MNNGRSGQTSERGLPHSCMSSSGNERLKAQEHFTKCECGEWIDMRDLGAVIDHEHWMQDKPAVSFSHVKKKGKENEVYIKAGERVITLKLSGKQ